MRVAVIVVAILALIGAILLLLSGMIGIFAGITILAQKIPQEAMEGIPMSQNQIGFGLVGVSILNILNGLMYAAFSIGTFMWKKWARILGIFAYALNIIVGFLTFFITKPGDSMLHLYVGMVVALICLLILVVGKKGYEKPLLP